MKRTAIVVAHLLVAAILLLALLAPRNMVYAQDETPPVSAAETAGESDPSADSGDGSHEGEDSGEAGDETSSESENASAGESEETPQEDESMDTSGGSGAEETSTTDEETDGTNDGDLSTGDDKGEVADTGSGSSDGDSEEEDSSDGESDEETDDNSDAEDLIALVQELAVADATLVKDNGEPIALSSAEAETLLTANATLLTGTLLTAAASASSTATVTATTTIAQDASNTIVSSTLEELGQTFRVLIDGEITSIEIASNTAGASTLTIYLGTATVGSTVLYTQSVALTDTVDSTGTTLNSYTYQTITLTTPLAVTAGQRYTFTLTDWVSAYQSGNAYGGGVVVYSSGGGSAWWTDGTNDLTFRVNMQYSYEYDLGTNVMANEEQKAAGIGPAEFVESQADYTLVPQGYSIGGVAWFTAESGYVSFALPDGASRDDVILMFWNGTEWKEMPGFYVEDGMAHGQVIPELGDGTYILVYRNL